MMPPPRAEVGVGDALAWRCVTHALAPATRPLVMGIVNVTPDSFSDGNRYLDPHDAIAHARQLITDGADIVDVGGESTRPGARAVSEAVELERVLPVIEAIAALPESPSGNPVLISIDTTKAAVAEAAVACGATIINDVSAMTADDRMRAVASATGAGVVLMHMQGDPRTMQGRPRYDDALQDVATYLSRRIDELVAAGLDPDTIAVDPGIGFGKDLNHNLDLLAGIPQLSGLGRPVVIGLSRKSMLGRITGREVGERLAGSLALLAYCVMRGAHVMRVHDVRESVDALAILKMVQAREQEAQHADI
jgi:dihydropteroate synthase